MSEEFELDDTGRSYIPIDETTRLLISPRNWQLQKKQVAITGKKAGETTWTSFRYYMTLQGALKDIIHIKVAQESFKSVQGLIDANTKVINDLTKSFSPEYEITQIESHP